MGSMGGLWLLRFACTGLLGDLEVDLLFEGVDAGYLDAELVTGFEDFPGILPDKPGAWPVEDIEIVVHRRNGHKARHHRLRQLDQ